MFKKPTLVMFSVLGLVLLSGCNTEEIISGGGAPEPNDPYLIDVAKTSAGATATSTFLPGDAGNLIDGDNTTYWQSDVDTPIVVELAQKERVMNFTLTRIDEGSITYGTNTQIIIELSSDGTNFETTTATGTGTLSCASNSSNRTVITCAFNDSRRGVDVTHIRVTTRFGLAFKFTNLEVVAERT